MTTGRHFDDDGDGIADRGQVEACDDRPRDADGTLLTGLPTDEVEDGY